MKKILILLICSCFIYGCSSEPKPIYANGVFSGEAEGMGGNVVVQVTIQNDIITEIKIEDNYETPSYMEEIETKLIPEIIGKNSLENIDVLAGATVSSNAVLNAINEALTHAKNELNVSEDE